MIIISKWRHIQKKQNTINKKEGKYTKWLAEVLKFRITFNLTGWNHYQYLHGNLLKSMGKKGDGAFLNVNHLSAKWKHTSSLVIKTGCPCLCPDKFPCII